MSARLMEAALAYGARGWALIPLKPNTKNQPLTPQGFKNASAEPGQIAAWWGRNPEANIAVAIEASGLLLVDFDPRNKDAEWKHRWPSQDYDDLLRRCEAEGTLSATTGSGGRHFLFLAPEELPNLRSILASGVDFKHNGYFVAAPSVHPDTGEEYRWDPWKDEDAPDVPVHPLPAWLLDMATVPEVEEAPKRAEPAPDDDRPGVRFNATASWAAILEPHGWTLVRREGEEEFWCRPGKTDSISATANYEGSGLFYVFTTSTEFEADRGYDKLGVYARLNHNGDIDAAIEDIRDNWLPVQESLELDDEVLDMLFRDQKPRLEETPEEWEFAFPDDHFVTHYMRYAMKQTSANPAYHEAAALALLAVATPLSRAFLSPYPGGLRTNLYVVLVGASSRSYKSTSQDIMLSVLRHYRDGALLPAKSTTESMVDQLSSANGISKIWTPDEFGMVIAEIGRRDHLRGVEDLLLELYSGKRYDYQTLSRGLVTITNAHLTVFGASAPETLALGGATAMLGGLLPRFGVVFPRKLPPFRKAAQVDREAIEKGARRLVDRLRYVQEAAQETPVVTFTAEAMERLNALEESLAAEGLHGARLPTMAYKVAMLSALGAGRSTVTAEDAASTEAVIERWKDGARHLQPFLRRKAADLEFERSMAAALDVLDELGGDAHRAQIARQLRWPKSRLDNVQAALIDQAYIRTTDEHHWVKRKEAK